MYEIQNVKYFPLTVEDVRKRVPPRPGVYMLAVRTHGGAYNNIFTTQAGDLQQALNSHVPRSHNRYRFYFTFFVILSERYREDIERILQSLVHPPEQSAAAASTLF
jgi:hypothetical protein